MCEGKVNILVFIDLGIQDNPDEMIELLMELGYSPEEHNIGGNVRMFSIDNMSNEDMVYVKLSIPSSYIISRNSQ